MFLRNLTAESAPPMAYRQLQPHLHRDPPHCGRSGPSSSPSILRKTLGWRGDGHVGRALNCFAASARGALPAPSLRNDVRIPRVQSRSPRAWRGGRWPARRGASHWRYRRARVFPGTMPVVKNRPADAPMKRLLPRPLKVERDFTDARPTGFGGWSALRLKGPGPISHRPPYPPMR